MEQRVSARRKGKFSITEPFASITSCNLCWRNLVLRIVLFKISVFIRLLCKDGCLINEKKCMKQPSSHGCIFLLFSICRSIALKEVVLWTRFSANGFSERKHYQKIACRGHKVRSSDLGVNNHLVPFLSSNLTKSVLNCMLMKCNAFMLLIILNLKAEKTIFTSDNGTDFWASTVSTANPLLFFSPGTMSRGLTPAALGSLQRHHSAAA